MTKGERTAIGPIGTVNRMRRTGVGAIAAMLWYAGSAGAMSTTSIVVTGVANPQTEDLAKLQSLPQVTQTDTYRSGASSATHTYTGPTLWSVLSDAGIATDPAVRNDGLNRVVLATGSDGYRVVYALGEINPNFGNRSSLVAVRETIGGVGVPLTADGFARITAPGDVAGGRYVSNLATLQVQATGATVTSTAGGRSTSFTIGGAVAASKSFDLAALEALPSLTRVVNGVTYTGTSLWNLLTVAVGIPLDTANKNDLLDKYVVATGSDGYQVAFSLGELSPNFGNEPDFIAYLADGVALTDTGFARIVVPDDVRAGRWVSNLVGFQVFSAQQVPEPAALSLVGLGAAAGFVGRRPRRTPV